MAGEGNILIADKSALFALLHGDWASRIEASLANTNPLYACATTLEGLSSFNVHNPLYGPPPISLLVHRSRDRRFSEAITCHLTSCDYPPGSFFKLRDGLYMTSPELTFIRMAPFVTEVQLAEIGMNLCARYFIDVHTDEINDRERFLTTPKKLRKFASTPPILPGSRKALSALRWVLPNSGSPAETKMELQYCLPLGRGGLALPFTAMNYDVRAGRLTPIMAQGKYSIDLANPKREVGLEYDGEDSHPDPSADKRRRNELKALGWDVFPIDKSVLYDPDATIRSAEQIAKHMGIRLRRSKNWEPKFHQLRKELGLSR